MRIKSLSLSLSTKSKRKGENGIQSGYIVACHSLSHILHSSPSFSVSHTTLYIFTSIHPSIEKELARSKIERQSHQDGVHPLPHLIVPGVAPWVAWVGTQLHCGEPWLGSHRDAPLRALLAIPTCEIPLLGGCPVRDGCRGRSAASVSGEPAGEPQGKEEDVRSHCVRKAGAAEHSLHCSDERGDASPAHAHGHGHQQRRRLDALLRLRWLLLCCVLLPQIHLLQDTALPGIPMQTGTATATATLFSSPVHLWTDNPCGIWDWQYGITAPLFVNHLHDENKRGN